MPTYTVNNPITTPKGKDFAVGDTATDKDIPASDVKWLLEQDIISVASASKSPKVRVAKEVTKEEEDGE
jgi:hypothetical protein